MKKILLTVLVFAGAQAQATKARVQAMANSYHIVDTQYVFSSPLDINNLSDFVTVETGVTAATNQNNGAEGMISYTVSPNNKLAVGFGHQQASVASAREFANTQYTQSLKLMQNPVHVVFGNTNDSNKYALGFYYSNYQDKVSTEKESSAGFTAGIELGKLQLYGEYVLDNTIASADGTKVDGAGYVGLTVVYSADTTTWFAAYNKGAIRANAGGVGGAELLSHTMENINVGFMDSTVKDGTDLFWGLALVSVKYNCRVDLSATCDKSATGLSLPVTIGVEANAADWLTLRGSIVQPVLVNQFKDDFGYKAGTIAGANGAVQDVAAGVNGTTLAIGSGIKFSKQFTVDGSMFTTLNNQTVTSDSVISQVGATYTF